MGKLFGVKAGSIVEYVVKAQRGDPAEERTTFLLRPLTTREHAEIQNKLYESSGWGKKRQERFLTGTQIVLILRKGLVGWKNFHYEDGEEVKWEDPNQERTEEGRDMIMDRNLDRLPNAVRQELAEELRGEAVLGEDE